MIRILPLNFSASAAFPFFVARVSVNVVRDFKLFPKQMRAKQLFKKYFQCFKHPGYFPK
jgi:hypothetical protein